jgi:AcrR family transcriptional regulator
VETTRERAPRRDAQRNRERLVAAARAVFAERGVDASLEEIARRAGVGIGTLYRHFPTRQALVGALYEERIGEFLAIAADARSSPDAWAGFSTFLVRTVELHACDHLLKDVLAQYPPGGEGLAGATEELRKAVDELLARAHAEGSLRADFTVSDLRLLFRSLRPVIEATADTQPDAWRRHLRFVLDGLRPAAAASAR